MSKINYLNNRDLLAEIHKSKNSFCAFAKPEYHNYDAIVTSLDSITPEVIEEAKLTRAKRVAQQNFDARRAAGEAVKATEIEFDASAVNELDLVFRVMTFDHIPLNDTRKKNPKSIADHRDKVNFPPFQHWKYNEAGQLICVGKSHWKGSLEDGHFSKDHGQFTNNLARMYIKLCERYATRGNVRSYTYNDEMKGQAILQLTQIGLQFDESKSNNPFAYFTAAVTNSFVRIINDEKRNQRIRDDLLEINGLNPSYTRTANMEYDAGVKRNAMLT